MKFLEVNGSYINIEQISVIFYQPIYYQAKKETINAATIATKDGREYSVEGTLEALVKRLGVEVV